MYTGQQRLIQHWRSAKIHAKPNMVLHKAIRKYGVEAFVAKNLVEGISSLEELNAAETSYIRELRSYLPGIGYNMTLGGDGMVPNEALRKRLSGRRPARKKMSLMTDERKAQLSVSLKGKNKGPYEKNIPTRWYLRPTKGKLFTQAHCDLISANCVNTNKTHCIRGHEFTKENTYVSSGHRSCRECSRQYLIFSRTKEPSARVLRNRQKTHCQKGHEYTVENTILVYNDQRICRECHLQNARNHAMRKRLAKCQG